MAYLLRDGTATTDRRLDRLVEFHPKSRAFPICGALTENQQSPVSKRWSAPYGTPVLDQGPDGACVGFGISNDLLYYPVAIRGIDATFAHEKIYWAAQRTDPWEGGSYPGATPTYDGTSVLAGMQTAQALGYYGEYRWGFSEPEMALGVSHLGPAIIGINWYDSMFQPNNKGYLDVTGDKMGGHCILVIGISTHYNYYVVHNSWGPNWGHHGTAKISRNNMARLLSEDGECSLVTERRTPTT